MELINGRTTDEVRRYDVFKLVVAVALMINWLFFWAGPLPESWGSPPAAPGTGSLFPTYASHPRPAAGQAERVDDRLRIEAGAPAYDWLPNLGSLLTGFGGSAPVSNTCWPSRSPMRPNAMSG